MGFFKRLFGKSVPKPAAGMPSTGHPGPAPASVDQLIAVWRKINPADGSPWVLFEHGTCVRLADPDADVFAQARALLREWGPVYPGTSAGDFNVERASGVPGWLVTCHHPDIITFVASSDPEQLPSQDSESVDLAIGLLGRSLRDRDARALGVIHIEDHRATGIASGVEAVRAWARLARRAWQARQERSDWGRYAIPVEGIAFLTEEQANLPPRSLDEISMPPEVRSQIEAMESVVRKSGRLPKPVTALSGFALAASLSNQGTPGIGGSFAPGQVVELQGFLSASAVVDPPLYAAGMEGAMLEIGIHSAADMSAVMPRQGEAEYLLPRDCRCRVLGMIADRSYRTQDGDHYVRALVQLQQL